MAKIVWDETTKHLYETGVDRAVLYPVKAADGTYPMGYAWNGVTAVTEKPSGAAATPLYADNTKYLNLIALEQFGFTLQAYTYPTEFEQCDGSVEVVSAAGVKLGQQSRVPFGFSFRTKLGNDAVGDSYGYKLHLAYGCTAAPAERAYATVNDSPSAINFSWDVTTIPVVVTDHRNVSLITIDSTKADSGALTALEAILYGTAEGGDPHLPLPDEVITLMGSGTPAAVTVTTVPDDEDTDVAVAASVVLTFNNKIAEESIVLATAAGVLKAVNRSWDATGKILTLDPTTNLAGGTVYILTIAGVVDIYGQALEAAVENFTTVT